MRETAPWVHKRRPSPVGTCCHSFECQPAHRISAETWLDLRDFEQLCIGTQIFSCVLDCGDQIADFYATTFDERLLYATVRRHCDARPQERFHTMGILSVYPCEASKISFVISHGFPLQQRVVTSSDIVVTQW
jgi:hypothetical protein